MVRRLRTKPHFFFVELRELIHISYINMIRSRWMTSIARKKKEKQISKSSLRTTENQSSQV